MILQNAIIIALAVFFVKASTWEGMLFDDLCQFCEEKLPEAIFKPVIGCVICMTPYWGAAFYYVAHIGSVPQFASSNLITIAATLFAASGINAVLALVHEFTITIIDIGERLKEDEDEDGEDGWPEHQTSQQ